MLCNLVKTLKTTPEIIQTFTMITTFFFSKCAFWCDGLDVWMLTHWRHWWLLNVSWCCVSLDDVSFHSAGCCVFCISASLKRNKKKRTSAKVFAKVFFFFNGLFGWMSISYAFSHFYYQCFYDPVFGAVTSRWTRFIFEVKQKPTEKLIR